MPRILARIARTLTLRWKRSLLVALLTLVALGALAGASSPAPDDFEIPGTESQQAIDLFRAHTPALAGGDATLVFSLPDGRVSSGAARAAIADALDAVRRLPGVVEVSDPFERVSRDGRLSAVDVRYRTDVQDIEPDDGQA